MTAVVDVVEPCSHARLRKLDLVEGWYACDACGMRLLVRVELALDAETARRLYELSDTPQFTAKTVVAIAKEAQDKTSALLEVAQNELQRMVAAAGSKIEYQSKQARDRLLRLSEVLSAKVVASPSPGLLDKSMDELELSVRAAHALEVLGVRWVGDLVQKTELDFKKAGRRPLKEIKEILAESGLSLGMKVEGWVRPDDVQKKDAGGTP